MCLFLLVSLYEFKQFLQIVLWIALPLTLVAVLITTILHYRRKKKRAGAESAYAQDIGFHTVLPSIDQQQLPDWLGSSQPDNIPLIKKYEQEVRRQRENYTLLEDDFRTLEKKYSDLLNKAYSTEKQDDDVIHTLQQEIQEHKQEIERLRQANVPAAAPAPEADLQRYYAQQLDELGKRYQSEKQELSTLLEQAHAQVAQLQGENTAVGSLQQSLAAAEEEKTILKNRLHEMEYLQDVVAEKKLHTDFLQNQLEQRIKSYHQLEHEATEKTGQLSQLQVSMQLVDTQVAQLKEELQQQQQEAANWQQSAEQHKEENRQQEDAIRSKITHIESLENDLDTLHQQQATLQAVIDDKQHAIVSLQDAIANEQQKAKELESKLELSSQLLVRIYSELAKSFNAGLMHLQNGPVPNLLNGSSGNGQLNGEYHFEEADREVAIH